MILLGAAPENVLLARQVHGKNIALASYLEDHAVEADGIFVDDPKLTVGVRTADCLPLTVTSPRGAVILHVSRQSLICGLLDALPRYLSTAAISSVYIGPHICQRHFSFTYEGPEITRFREKFPAAVHGTEILHLSLRQAVQSYLDAWGVRETATGEDWRCTYEDLPQHSYRYSLAGPGRSAQPIITCLTKAQPACGRAELAPQYTHGTGELG